MILNTVLFFARDPGGANVVRPIYGKMKGKYNTMLYAKEFALKKFREENYPVEDIQACGIDTYEGILSFLKRMNPDAVITGTSLDDFTERYLWKAANNLHIKAFAILDQWMNLGIRFSAYDYGREEEYHNHLEHPYLPYRIFAMDGFVKEQLEKEGISGDKIVLTGQPHFDTVRERFRYAGQVYDNRRWNVVFASEPIYQDYDNCQETKLYWGYNERTIFDSLYRSLQKLAESYSRKIRLIIRPHPREEQANWKQRMEKLRDDNVMLEMDRENDSFSVMKSADLVCGMSSMFLLESVMCQKPVISIEIGLKRDNPFILDKIGYCKSALSEEELQKSLEQAFYSSQNGDNKISQVYENMIGYPKGVCNATEQIVRLVEEEMER